MSGKMIKILLGAGAAAGAATMGAGAYFARKLVRPHTFSLEEEKKWEYEHGLWGNYDQIPCTNYMVVGKDGCVLHCEYAEANPGSRKVVILTHGYTSNRYGMVKYVGVYARLGFNCILYDCRGHGENVPAPCSIGNLEAADLLQVIEYAYRRFGEEIELGLHGESMGSSASLSVLKYHPKVKFVVADCGFASLYDLMKVIYGRRHLAFLRTPTNFMMRKLYHIDMRKTCARDALKGNQIPICLIHGTDDTFIPVENSDELADATAGYQEVHKIKGADHAKARSVIGEDKYLQIVKEFLEHIS